MTTTGLQTQYPFTLPLGYRSEDGRLHRDGTIRLATARDEILPLADPRVRENAAYLPVLRLARVVVELGDLAEVRPETIEGLFVADLAFLQDLYERINGKGQTHAIVDCPACGSEYAVELNTGSSAVA